MGVGVGVVAGGSGSEIGFEVGLWVVEEMR